MLPQARDTGAWKAPLFGEALYRPRSLATLPQLTQALDPGLVSPVSSLEHTRISRWLPRAEAGLLEPG